MEKEYLPDAAGVLSKKRRRRRWQKVVGALAAVVVFCTTYALILPAITEEHELVCGLEEHTHTETCYQETQRPICGLEETEGHLHSDDCYIEEPVLLCGLEETEGHAHTDDCYTEQPVLLCGQEESEDHVHSEECWGTERVLTCGQEETEPHTHSEECWGTERVLACGQEEAEPHVHTEACYETEQTLICEQEEHTHTEECYAPVEDEPESDPTADVETQADWEATLRDVTLTGEWPLDVLAVAESQLGYQESSRNFAINEDGKLKGYTRYGAWYGDPYGDWCAMFASFCLHYAEVEDFPLEANCQRWIEALRDEKVDLYREAHPEEPEEPYLPNPGDLIFFDWESGEEADHVGFVAEFIPASDGVPAQVKTLEGNAGDRVRYETYEASDSRILGYAALPEQTFYCGLPGHVHEAACYDAADELVCGFEEHIHTEECEVPPPEEPAQSETPEEPEMVRMPDTFTYENESLFLTLHVAGEVELSETEEPEPAENDDVLSTEENASEQPEAAELQMEKVQMDVAVLEKDSAEYAALYDQVRADNGEDRLYDLEIMSIQFTYDGQPLDVSSCAITAEISAKQPMLTPPAEEAETEVREESAPEAEEGIVLTALSQSGESVSQLEQIMLAADDPAEATFSVAMDDVGILAVAAAQTANPSFTVQYYANLERAVGSGENELTVINTDNGGNGTGGNLPVNGNMNLPTKNIYLEPASNGKYELATETVLTPIYTDHTYQYILAPNLTYFNRLYENGNYGLKEIWVLKDGMDQFSTDPGDWDIYNPETTHFTNRQQSVNDNTVLIRENTVIRLVYDTTDSVYNNAAIFYDYDISDGTKTEKYDSANRMYYTLTNTAHYGINSASNYSGSGVKLAVGNKNAGTDFGTLVWNGNELNKYNNNGFSGCTFGLTSGLNASGEIQYSSGIIAPKLFNDGSASGKTEFDDYSLAFNRVGDTYTFSAVNGTNAVGLEFFDSTKYDSSMTNSFWPMDSASTFGAEGHDLKFGDDTLQFARRFADGYWSSLPRSDDGTDHNSYFGMQYSVQFKLTEDYVGPLEYYFFGDDDMWVFLDGRLVCDIGGVHSSVGEYVNLWDYIKKGDSGTHTLSFFYTERGASGSTCFMRFTLPSVSSITPEQNTGQLKVEKQLIGASDDTTEFCFDIKFTDASGNPLPDDYAYTRYDSLGNIVKQDVIIYDGGSFELKAGEYIIVRYLPYGTQYEIIETNIDGYRVSYTVDASDGVSSATARGSVSKTGVNTVVFTNEYLYALPETGGGGTLWFTLGGTALMLAAAGMYRYKKRRREVM